MKVSEMKDHNFMFSFTNDNHFAYYGVNICWYSFVLPSLCKLSGDCSNYWDCVYSRNCLCVDQQDSVNPLFISCVYTCVHSMIVYRCIIHIPIYLLRKHQTSEFPHFCRLSYSVHIVSVILYTATDNHPPVQVWNTSTLTGHLTHTQPLTRRLHWLQSMPLISPLTTFSAW